VTIKIFGLNIVEFVRSDAWCGDVESFKPARRWCGDGLLITLLKLKYVVLVLYFSVYYYLCSFNYSLFFCSLLFSFFCLWGIVGIVYFGFLICIHGNDYFQFSVFFHVNVSLFFYFFDPFVYFLLVFCG